MNKENIEQKLRDGLKAKLEQQTELMVPAQLDGRIFDIIDQQAGLKAAADSEFSQAAPEKWLAYAFGCLLLGVMVFAIYSNSQQLPQLDTSEELMLVIEDSKYLEDSLSNYSSSVVLTAGSRVEEVKLHQEIEQIDSILSELHAHADNDSIKIQYWKKRIQKLRFLKMLYDQEIEPMRI